jgi:hypothetical protein
MEEIAVTQIIEKGLIIVFIVLVIAFIYFGITFVHHWNYYSFNIQIKRVMEGTYFFGGSIVLITLLVLIGLYFLEYGF